MRSARADMCFLIKKFKLYDTLNFYIIYYYIIRILRRAKKNHSHFSPKEYMYWGA